MPDEPIPTPATPAVAVAPAPVTNTVTPPPAPPAGITISATDYTEFMATRTRLAAIEQERAREVAEANAREVAALAQKGQIEGALTMLRQQAQADLDAERVKSRATEDRAKRYALDGELARSLSSQPLVPGGAEQLTQLWRSQFHVQPEGDSFAVRTPAFQSVGDFVTQQLARPEYAHFVRAGNPGGGHHGGGGNLTIPTPAASPAPPVVPANMGEAVILHMQSLAKNTNDPASDMSQSFGLKRRG